MKIPISVNRNCLRLEGISTFRRVKALTNYIAFTIAQAPGSNFREVMNLIAITIGTKEAAPEAAVFAEVLGISQYVSNSVEIPSGNQSPSYFE